MTKLDLYQKHKADYATPKQPVLLDIAPAQYLAVSGEGDPADPAFMRAMGALYAMAFTIKMAAKAAGRDYVVSKPEGLWWCAKREQSLGAVPKQDWRWMLIMRTPDFITPAHRTWALKALKERGKDAGAADVKLLKLKEGRCVQMLHVGPYADETTTIDAMLAFAAGAGCRPKGRHHEIYLNDPRRTAPAKLRTILRQPLSSRPARRGPRRA